jgi:hypothetical protein
MFDKYWYPEADRLTLPFCFFHISGYKERRQVEVSKRRVILYEPPNERGEDEEDLSDPLRPGVMQTVADNLVVQPKEYQLDLVVPFLPVDRTIKERRSVLDNLIGGFGDLVGSMPETTISWLESKISVVRTMLDKASVADVVQRNLLGGNDDTDIDWENRDSLTGSDAMANKNSLDAMVGKIVMLKTWIGDDYKYVVITDKTFEKKSTEDGVWRVTLNCQEMPVLSIAPVEGETEAPDRAWVAGVSDALGGLAGLSGYKVLALEPSGEA